MASWGDINAALNKLVREGAIAGFRTNRGDKSAQTHLHVTVTAPDGEDEEAVRQRILAVLLPLDEEATVTVGAAAA